MYIPRAFERTDRAELLDFIRAHSFGILTSMLDDRPFASHLPFVVADQDGQLLLRAHLARPNPQWRTLEGAEALVVFPGQHAYVSPSAYDTLSNVPTWNYVTVHAQGRASLVHDPERLRGMLAELIAANEPAYQQQWDSLPARYQEGMLGGIVGVEIRVSRLEGKFKLSQNRTIAERERVAAALEERGDPDALGVAVWMRRQLSEERGTSRHGAGDIPAVRDETGVGAAEARFFDALLRGSRAELERVLGADFLLIDVMTGTEIPRSTLVDLVGSGQLVFEAIERLQARVRLYHGTAVATGETRMSGRYGEQRFAAHSRYTHVYVRGADGWRLVTAQGTPVAPAGG